MLTLLLAFVVGSIGAYVGYVIYPSYILASIMFILSMIAFNFFMSRHFLKQLTNIFSSCEKDIQAGKVDVAIEKLKKGYIYAKWQFMVTKQIDSQIGILLYAHKRFDEALPYLKSTPKANYMAMSMLAGYHYKQKNFDEVERVMANAVKGAPKDGFTQVLNAYFLSEFGKKDKAIEALVAASKKLPNDERIENALDALKNNKKIKIQNYGMQWAQLHLSKMPEGGKMYQTFIPRQKLKRR